MHEIDWIAIECLGQDLLVNPSTLASHILIQRSRCLRARNQLTLNLRAFHCKNERSVISFGEDPVEHAEDLFRAATGVGPDLGEGIGDAQYGKAHGCILSATGDYFIAIVWPYQALGDEIAG